MTEVQDIMVNVGACSKNMTSRGVSYEMSVQL